VPPGTTTLSFWYWPTTADDLCSGSACVFDWQEAQIRSTSGTTLASVFKSNSNAQAWTHVTFDTSAYAGQTVVLWFNVHEDGASPPDDTSMYLDDVTLTVAGGPTVPAAPTGVNATAGNGSAVVSWTAPSNGGMAITSYTVTPYIGSTAQTPVTVNGSPPATSTTVPGLTNGTSYTFTVYATNSVGSGPASAASNAVTPTAPTAPGAPTGVNATAGNGSAVVSWTAPSNGGMAITSYTVTPYIGSTAQTSVPVNGSPPATSTTVNGLTNGTAYTFTVYATNSVGAGPASAQSNPVTPTATVAPAYVQQASAHGANKTSLAVTPTTNVTAGNRLVVLVGVWASSNTTAKSVTDSAGNTYVEVLHFTASDGTEMSVWTAPITSGGGTKPTITATVTASADVGVTALEYSGLSAVTDASVVDQAAHATGTTSGSATVSSGTTAATTASNELALGLYVDSGFGDTLTAGAGYTARTNVSPAGDMEMLAEDQVLGAAGATPNAGIGTGPSTIWLAATVVLKNGGPPPPPTVPAAPTGVSVTAGNGSAVVSWTAPSSGGSAITSYTVTPFIGSTAQTPVTVTGSPPATSTPVPGLTNGTTYTFTVSATNAVGTGPASTQSNAVTPTATVVPAFVQQASAHGASKASLAVTPTGNVTAGNRLVVLVGVWANGHATTGTVTDSAGNTYIEVLHFTASDGTEMSVWTAPITKGGGTKPIITATPSATADVGVTALEYSGLSSVADATVVDQAAQATGTTTGSATVSSGPTAATTASNELALGLYVDSGFGDTLTAGAGYTARTNVSPAGDIEMLAEDQVLGAAGATPNGGIGTGPGTIWLAATIVLKHS
jgi:hypothetical protein